MICFVSAAESSWVTNREENKVGSESNSALKIIAPIPSYLPVFNEMRQLFVNFRIHDNGLCKWIEYNCYQCDSNIMQLWILLW